MKRYKSEVSIGAPKLAVKRSGLKFSELAQAALNSKSTESWGFKYNGSPLKDMEKTLIQVQFISLARRSACFTSDIDG